MIYPGIVNACIREALKSDYKFMMGAVIFKNKRILSVGYNQIRSCSFIPESKRKWSNSLHAEQAAILRASSYKILKGASILVMKISKTEHSISNARPCDYCLSSLDYVGIKKIYYSNEMGEIEYERI